MGQLVFQATAGGQVALVGPNPSTNFSINVPAITGTLVTTGDTGTVTNTMLASSAYTAPGTIGSGTPNTGAFTTLSANSTVSGTGFSNYLASPPAIGGTAANTGKFTSVTDTGLTSGRVTYAGTSGLLQDSANLVFNGTNLAVGTNSTTTAILTVAGPQYDNKNTANIFSYDTTGVAADIGGGLMMGGYYTGTSPTAWAAISGLKNNATSGDYGGYLVFKSRANGSLLTEAMRIDSSGNLLVGTTSLIAAIGNSGQTKLNAYGNGLAVNNGTSSAVFGGPNGNEGIWFTGGAFRVFNASVVGMYLLNGGTSWSNTSDETVKDIIEPISNGLQKVTTLRSIIGKYKKDKEGTRRSFLIAQDVQKVLPEAVTELDGVLGVNYTDVIPLLVAAINDMKQQFDAYVASHP
jgi:hypothetical protein